MTADILYAGKQDGKESSSRAKVQAMNELYAELASEGERNISRILKPTDITENNQIKYE